MLYHNLFFILHCLVAVGILIVESKSPLASNITKNSYDVSETHKDVPNNHVKLNTRVTSESIGHQGREHVVEPPVALPAAKLPSKDVKTASNKSIVAEISKLDVAPQKDDDKLSVPKKGVSFTDLESNTPKEINKTDSNNKQLTNSAANLTVIHKKPLFTEPGDESLENKQKKEDKTATVNVEQRNPILLHKNSQRADYIIPIVAVILSVPVLAILMSFVYRRGTYWWQHRNYKRMDFLIEGMYQN